MADPQPYLVTPEQAAAIEQVVRWVQGMNGPGISKPPHGITIRFPQVVGGTSAGATGGSNVIPVTVATDGGTAGTASAACTFTYTVSTYGTSDGAYGATVAPVMQRSTKGKMVSAVVGIWSGSQSVLIWCDEVPDRGCGTACT